MVSYNHREHLKHKEVHIMIYLKSFTVTTVTGITRRYIVSLDDGLCWEADSLHEALKMVRLLQCG